MMRCILFLILISGLHTPVVSGQHSHREVYPRQVLIKHNDAVQRFSSTYASTALNGSSSAGLQPLESTSGHWALVNVTGIENTTVLTQTGYRITGIIDIYGQLNNTHMHQKGADLQSILNIRGNANQFNMTQLGTNLQSHFQIFGSDLNVDAVQTNEGMKLIQSGSRSIPFSIQQAGPPSPVIIRTN